jgi:hypothetical protein
LEICASSGRFSVSHNFITASLLLLNVLTVPSLSRVRGTRPVFRIPPNTRPSSKVRLARGLNTPSGGVRLARGHPHARCPRSCPRVQAFNAMTPQDARRDLGTPGNRVPALFHQLPGGGHPRRCVALCGKAGVSSVTLCRLPPYG